MTQSYEQQVIQAIKKVLPAVVSIVVSKDLEDLKKNNPFGYFQLGQAMPEGEEQTPESMLDELPRTKEGKIKVGGGSGFIVSPDGIILTNKHVVMDPTAEYGVITATDDLYQARVLAADPINDVAILKIDADKEILPVVPIGDSNKVELGQSVITIGTALGEFQNTVSTGIISGLSRFITAVTDLMGHQERLRGLIQTDAAINPGNSGGPLINLSGEAIGINSAVVFGAQNIGFAIPINKVKEDLDAFRKSGKIIKPFLGVRYMLINKAIQKKFNLPVDAGAMILREHGPDSHGIVPGSPAEKAGLRDYDIILKCNGKSLSEKTTMEDILDSVSIGDTVSLAILRDGKEMDVSITVGER
jgi:serine protease Do